MLRPRCAPVPRRFHTVSLCRLAHLATCTPCVATNTLHKARPLQENQRRPNILVALDFGFAVRESSRDQDLESRDTFQQQALPRTRSSSVRRTMKSLVLIFIAKHDAHNPSCYEPPRDLSAPHAKTRVLPRVICSTMRVYVSACAALLRAYPILQSNASLHTVGCKSQQENIAVNTLWSNSLRHLVMRLCSLLRSSESHTTTAAVTFWWSSSLSGVHAISAT